MGVSHETERYILLSQVEKMQSCKKQINLGYRDVSMIWLGTHVTRAVVSGHAAALNGNKFRGCQPETVRKWVAEMSTNALSHNLGICCPIGNTGAV